MLGERYGFWAAIMAGWQMRTGIWNGINAPNYGPQIICSKVFYDAFTEITEVILDGCKITELITPAHLSATTGLTDIAVPWLKLKKEG